MKAIDIYGRRLTSKREVVLVEAEMLDFLERYLMEKKILGLLAFGRDMHRGAPLPVLLDPAVVELAVLGLRSH